MTADMNRDTIRELPDPWSPLGRTRLLLARARRLAGRAKRRLLPSGRIMQVPPPVVGYTEGADGELDKRALIAYVARPFYTTPEQLRFPAHSNIPQSVEIARAFNRLGYVVDVVDWLDNTFVPSTRYDVFFGMHYNFERLLPYLDETTVRIYYGTGAYWAFEIAAEEERVDRLKKRRGIELELPVRLGENNWVQIADAVIVLADEFILSTYRPHTSRLFAIDNSARLTVAPADLEHKDFALARRNFLWFGSTGLLHKGLDLVLEAFVELSDLDLWVCGPLQTRGERGFLRAYRQELFHTPNIHPVGWTSIYSEQFRQLRDRCSFTVLATCSENMSGTVLDCMGSGIIPLVSQEAGVDTGKFGVTFPENSTGSICETVINAAATPPRTCKRMAKEAFSQATTRYTLASFSRNIEQALRAILAS